MLSIKAEQDAGTWSTIFNTLVGALGKYWKEVWVSRKNVPEGQEPVPRLWGGPIPACLSKDDSMRRVHWGKVFGSFGLCWPVHFYPHFGVISVLAHGDDSILPLCFSFDMSLDPSFPWDAIVFPHGSSLLLWWVTLILSLLLVTFSESFTFPYLLVFPPLLMALPSSAPF